MARSFAGGTEKVHFVVTPAQPALGCLAGWLKTTQAAASVSVLTYCDATSRNGFLMLSQATGKIQVVGYDATTNRIGASLISAGAINDGNWHHVAYNFNRGSGQANDLYIDGGLSATVNATAAWGNNGTGVFLEAAKNLDSFWSPYIGSMAEIGFWGGAKLTADEIAALAKGFSPQLVRPSALLLYASLLRDVKDLRSGFATDSTVDGAVADHCRAIAR